MIEQFINPYYQNVDSISGDALPSPLEFMFAKYIKSVDECLYSNFKKLYSADVFGLGSLKYLQNLDVIKMTFFQYLFMKEEIEWDILNDDAKSEGFYFDKYNLSCENLASKLTCIKCKDYKIIEAMIGSSDYEFSEDFNNDFN